MGLFDRFRRPSQPVREEGPLVLRAANLQGIGEREGQEDSFAVCNITDASEMERRGLLALVADGMGGMADGKAASEWTVEQLLRLFWEREAGEAVPVWAYRSVHAVSDSVYQRFGGRSGSTLVMVHIQAGRLHWASVGDSAIFLRRGGGVFQLDREHTCLNRLYLQALAQPVIDKTAAERDPEAPRLTSFIGIDRLTEVDLSLRPLLLQRGDALLLCSDGISGILAPPEIGEAMALPPEEGCALLEQMVAEKGVIGQDNYTAILLSCE